MKNLYLMALAFLCISYLNSAFAASSIACSHPEICRLAKIIFQENKQSQMQFNTLVNIVGDPHEFEPDITTIKNLIKAELLITGPSELNPWAKKVNYQRSKDSKVQTIALTLDKKDFDLYPGASIEALSHFWLYPKIFCALKSRLEDQMVALKLLVILPSRRSCAKEETLILQELINTLAKVKLPIVLTHDALLPILEFVANEDVSVVAIKGSGHHQETSAESVKKLYDTLKLPRVVWIEETGINVPQNILAKKRSRDLTIKIDTANSSGLAYFQVLSNLNDQLKALKL